MRVGRAQTSCEPPREGMIGYPDHGITYIQTPLPTSTTHSVRARREEGVSHARVQRGYQAEDMGDTIVNTTRLIS